MGIVFIFGWLLLVVFSSLQIFIGIATILSITNVAHVKLVDNIVQVFNNSILEQNIFNLTPTFDLVISGILIGTALFAIILSILNLVKFKTNSQTIASPLTLIYLIFLMGIFILIGKVSTLVYAASILFCLILIIIPLTSRQVLIRYIETREEISLRKDGNSSKRKKFKPNDFEDVNSVIDINTENSLDKVAKIKSNDKAFEGDQTQHFIPEEPENNFESSLETENNDIQKGFFQKNNTKTHNVLFDKNLVDSNQESTLEKEQKAIQDALFTPEESRDEIVTPIELNNEAVQEFPLNEDATPIILSYNDEQQVPSDEPIILTGDDEQQVPSDEPIILTGDDEQQVPSDEPIILTGDDEQQVPSDEPIIFSDNDGNYSSNEESIIDESSLEKNKNDEEIIIEMSSEESTEMSEPELSVDEEPKIIETSTEEDNIAQTMQNESSFQEPIFNLNENISEHEMSKSDKKAAKKVLKKQKRNLVQEDLIVNTNNNLQNEFPMQEPDMMQTNLVNSEQNPPQVDLANQEDLGYQQPQMKIKRNLFSKNKNIHTFKPFHDLGNSNNFVNVNQSPTSNMIPDSENINNKIQQKEQIQDQLSSNLNSNINETEIMKNKQFDSQTIGLKNSKNPEVKSELKVEILNDNVEKTEINVANNQDLETLRDEISREAIQKLDNLLKTAGKHRQNFAKIISESPSSEGISRPSKRFKNYILHYNKLVKKINKFITSNKIFEEYEILNFADPVMEWNKFSNTFSERLVDEKIKDVKADSNLTEPFDNKSLEIIRLDEPLEEQSLNIPKETLETEINETITELQSDTNKTEKIEVTEQEPITSITIEEAPIVDNFVNEILKEESVNFESEPSIIVESKEKTEEIKEPTIEFVKEKTEEIKEPTIEFVKEKTEEIKEPTIEFVKEKTEEIKEPTIEFVKEKTEEIKEPTIEFVKEKTEEILIQPQKEPTQNIKKEPTSQKPSITAVIREIDKNQSKSKAELMNQMNQMQKHFDKKLVKTDKKIEKLDKDFKIKLSTKNKIAKAKSETKVEDIKQYESLYTKVPEQRDYNDQIYRKNEINNVNNINGNYRHASLHNISKYTRQNVPYDKNCLICNSNESDKTMEFNLPN